MSQGMGFLKRGLKEVGLDSVLGVAPGESDDEEEAAMGLVGDITSPVQGRCGVKALVNAFLNEVGKCERGSTGLEIHLGLRHCSLDHGAADALAAMMVSAKDHGIDLKLDLRLNSILEDDMVASLEGQPEYSGRLAEMAERHMDALEATRTARKRSAEASLSHMNQADHFDSSWDLPVTMDEEKSVEADEWDSDAGALFYT
jgi:hypothetical protein